MTSLRWLALASGAALAGLAVIQGAGGAERLSGFARTVDGDTIIVNGRHIRLENFDAPEMDTAAGKAARLALQRILAGKPLECAGHRQDRYGRLVARCWTASGDIGDLMRAAGVREERRDHRPVRH